MKWMAVGVPLVGTLWSVSINEAMVGKPWRGEKWWTLANEAKGHLREVSHDRKGAVDETGGTHEGCPYMGDARRM